VGEKWINLNMKRVTLGKITVLLRCQRALCLYWASRDAFCWAIRRSTFEGVVSDQVEAASALTQNENRMIWTHYSKGSAVYERQLCQLKEQQWKPKQKRVCSPHQTEHPMDLLLSILSSEKEKRDGQKISINFITRDAINTETNLENCLLNNNAACSYWKLNKIHSLSECYWVHHIVF